MDSNNKPAAVTIKARGRGRPKKARPESVDFLLPTIKEEAPPPRMVVVNDEPAATAYTEVVSLGGELDLSDIAKPAEIEEDAWHAEAEPVHDVPSFSLGIASSPIVPQESNESRTLSTSASESEEDRKERLLLISKLKRYATEFPAFATQAINPDGSLNSLKNQLDEIRGLIQNKTTGILLKRTYLTSVSTLEVIGAKTNTAKLNGLADLLSRSEEVDECLKQLSCEMHIEYISPIKKLAFITLSSAYVLHTLNQKSEIFNEFGKEKAKAEVVNDFKDL